MTTAIATPLEINRAYYAAHADDFRVRAEALPMDSVYQPFLRLLPPHAHILDAGCGSGRDAAAFASLGHRVTAIDASPAMVQIAKSQGIDAHAMTFQRMTFNQEFDGIWACASVLHVPHAEVPEILHRFARALKPGGALYVSLKEGQGERVAEDGRFFSYFTLDEFSRMLTNRGMFEVAETWKNSSPDSSGTARAWLNFFARKIG
jgi:2-polyprenyl-3-methyl-5-hydroxy-6-metoxy-1,4-benzoquinol methylase